MSMASLSADAAGATVTPDTIDPREAAHFGRMAADWWDPKGSSAMLHKLNPPRLRYIREQVDARWRGAPDSFTPLMGKTVLDVGCGAGLLCEPLARLGGAVTGIDAAPENVAVAQGHASLTGLAIDYRAGSVAALRADERFDLITCMEVIEHVHDRATFLRGLADALADDGLMILSTPNRTALSRAALIGIAEGAGLIPRGTHDWHRFLTPDELAALLGEQGLRVIDVRGLVLSPATGFTLGESTVLDHFVTAVRA